MSNEAKERKKERWRKKKKDEEEEERKKKKKKTKGTCKSICGFFSNFSFHYTNNKDDNDLCNETSKYDFNRISINIAIVARIDIYYFPYKN